MVQTRSSGLEANGGMQAKPASKNRADGSQPADISAKRALLPETTDRQRWRLRDDAGCQTWHYLEDDDEAKEWPQSLADKYFLGLPMVRFDSNLHLRQHTQVRPIP